MAVAKVAADKADKVVAADKAAGKAVAMAAVNPAEQRGGGETIIERRRARRMQTGWSMKHSASPFGLGRVLKTQNHDGEAS